MAERIEQMIADVERWENQAKKRLQKRRLDDLAVALEQLSEPARRRTRKQLASILAKVDWQQDLESVSAAEFLAALKG